MPLPEMFQPDSPLIVDYMTRNPDSWITTILQAEHGPIPNAPLFSGGNNPTHPTNPYTNPAGIPTAPAPTGGVGSGSMDISGRLAQGGNSLVAGSNNANRTGLPIPPGSAPGRPSDATAAYRPNTGYNPASELPGYIQPTMPSNPRASQPFPFMFQPPPDPRDVSGMPRTVAQFAGGGMMTAQGTAIPPGAPMGRPPVAGPQDQPLLGADAPAKMDPAQMQQEAQNFVRSNPQVVQKVQAVMMQAIQSGELSYEELNLAVQLAKTALTNPAAYPQIRQFAIQNGLGTEADIPQQFDQGLLFVLLVVGQSLQQAGGPQGGQGSAMTGQAPAPSMQKGGMLPEYADGGMTKGKADKGHLAILHGEEYVVDKDTLLYHGKKTFDKLYEQAREPKDGQ